MIGPALGGSGACRRRTSERTAGSPSLDVSHMQQQRTRTRFVLGVARRKSCLLAPTAASPRDNRTSVGALRPSGRPSRRPRSALLALERLAALKKFAPDGSATFSPGGSGSVRVPKALHLRPVGAHLNKLQSGRRGVADTKEDEASCAGRWRAGIGNAGAGQSLFSSERYIHGAGWRVRVDAAPAAARTVLAAAAVNREVRPVCC